MFLESFSVAVSGIIGIALGTKKTDLELSHGFCHSESDPKSALTAGCSSSHTRIDQIRLKILGQFWIVPVIAKMDALKVNILKIPVHYP